MAAAERKTDGVLLGEFVRSERPEAFEEIVRRHGAMVLKVCRRRLGKSHDAEDAAQAVFLMLSRKASALQDRATLSTWLHHAARYVALDALRALANRRKFEREAAEMHRSVDYGRAVNQEFLQLLDQELDALPDKYRAPLILHYLEGRTKEDTAYELGQNPGTVASLLQRGRELLRNRLARQGVAVSGGALLALIAEQAASAAISPAFVASTVKAATLTAAGKATEGLISAHVGALVKGGLKTMFLAKMKVAAAVALTAGMVGTVGGVAALRAFAPAPAQEQERVAAPAAAEIPVGQFKKLFELIKPSAEEFAWREEIPWLIDIQEAREKAVAEGKPMLLWMAAAGNLLGGQ